MAIDDLRRTIDDELRAFTKDASSRPNGYSAWPRKELAGAAACRRGLASVEPATNSCHVRRGRFGFPAGPGDR